MPMTGRVLKQAVASMVALAVALTLTVSPAAASKTLFSDALKKPSKAVKPERGSYDRTRFEHGHFVIQVTDNKAFSSTPDFRASADQLSRVSISVDASIDSSDGSAGIVCRQNRTTGAEYQLTISTTKPPIWILTKRRSSGLGEVALLGSGSEALKKRPRSNNVRLDCIGPTEPGVAGTVTLEVFMNRTLVSTVQDNALSDADHPAPALSAGPVGLFVEGPVRARFNNLKVTQR